MGLKHQADTTWLIALFDYENENHKKALREFEELTSPPAISAVALTEILVGIEKGDLPTTIDELRKALPHIVPIDTEISISAARIKSANKLSLENAIIVATALREKSELLTFDKSMKVVYERIK